MPAAPTVARFCERAARLYGQERNGGPLSRRAGRYVANFARWARGGLARQRAAPLAESKKIARPSDGSEALPERVTEIFCVPENARL
jgi:hypothetical protein